MRIEAHGYRTAISREIKSGERSATLDFELEEAKGVEAVVLAPDGSPAVRAHVGLSDGSHGIGIMDGELMENAAYTTRAGTDQNGRFQFHHQESSFNLFVAHHEGYAQLTATMDSLPTQIKLERWARIEGAFRIANKPVADVKMNIMHFTNFQQFPNNSVNHTALTKQDGTFIMERLIPGQITICRLNLFEPGKGYAEAASVCQLPIKLVAGETSRVDFGVTGRPIVGVLQTAVPNDRINWKEARICLRHAVNVLPKLGEPPIPEGIRNKPKEMEEWFQNWKQTDEGRAWIALQEAHQANFTHRQSSPVYTASANADGAFRLEDIPAGKYELEIDCGVHRNLRLANPMSHIVVPEMENNRSDVELDLGVLKCEL